MSCTVIGGYPESKPPILASTSDDVYSSRSKLVVKRADGVKYVGVETESADEAVNWGGAVNRSVNEYGLAFTWSYVSSADDSERGNGLPLEDTLRGVATSRSIPEAVDHLQRSGTDVSGCFLLAHSNEDALAVVEVSGSTSVVDRHPDSGVIARTNEFQSPELTSLESSDGTPYRRTAATRRARVGELLDDDFDVDNAMSVLVDHAGRERDGTYGGSICNHGTDYGSVSAEILVPETGSLCFTAGWPCGTWEPENRLHQPWGAFFEFSTSLPVGTYTTVDGALTSRGVAGIADGTIQRRHSAKQTSH